MISSRVAGMLVAAVSIWMALPASARTVLPDGPLLRGEVVLSGDWAFACNNRGVCNAIGMPDPKPAIDPDLANLTPIVVRIALLHDPTSGAFVWIHLPASIDRLAGLSLGTKAGLGPLARSGPLGLLIPQEQVEGLLQELDRSTPHIVHKAKSGEAVARLPQHGFGWGFAAIKRVHLQYRKASPNAVDAAIRPDNVVTISAPEVVRADALPSLAAADCSGHSARLVARIYPLGDGSRLWQYVCAGDDSDDGPSLLYSQKDASAPLMPVILPDPVGSPINAGQVWLRAIDLTSGALLSSVAYAGPGKDCGKYWIWALTRDGFRLIAKREMPKCGTGLNEGLWLDTYDASFPCDAGSQKSGMSEK